MGAVNQNGFLGNVGLIDSLVGDCEQAVRCLHSGQHISFCKVMLDMVVKLGNLRNGVINDMKSMQEQIASLKKLLQDNGVALVDVSESELAQAMSEEDKTE